MTLKFFTLKNLPIIRRKALLIVSTVALILTIPLLLWGISQKQETRKNAAEPETFPQVDLNADGVINNIDLQIYRTRFATPIP